MKASSIHRCACCGRTNNTRVIQFADEFTLGPFYKDKHGKYPWDVVCADCLNTTKEINTPFDEEEMERNAQFAFIYF